MPAIKGLGTTGLSGGTVTPLDHKLAQSGLIAKTGAGSNLIRPGLFYDGVTNIVLGKANMSYDVVPFTAALTRGAAAGTVLSGNPGVENVVTTAAPGSNSRIDVVYIWQREASLDGLNSDPVIGVVQGTAAVSPTVPSLAAFPGALELARITVAAGATATNGAGVTITQTAPFTCTAGGVLPFRSTTERNAATIAEGQLGWLIDSNVLEVFNGSAWVQLREGIACSLRRSANQNLTASLAAVSWDVEQSDPANMRDPGNPTRIVAPVAGLYEVTASLYNNNTSGLGNCEGRLNGTTAITGSFDRRTGDAGGLSLKCIFSIALAANDYIEIMVQHATAAGAIEGGTGRTGAVVTMKRIGPA